MDLVQYLREEYKLESNSYKKWSEVSSDHFFLFEIENDLINFSHQRKLAKKHIEEFAETGNHFIFVSSPFHKVNGTADVPLFLCPVEPQIDFKNKKIKWLPAGTNYASNDDVFDTRLQLEQLEIEPFLIETNVEFVKKKPALFIHINSRKFIQKDLSSILDNNIESNALKAIFSLEPKPRTESIPLDFFSLRHLFPMDASQYEAIVSAGMNAIVISGPPGTGKSQTILNLALNEIINGKRVLIMSEKQVALEILYQRLQSIQLSSLALYITNQKSNQELFQGFEIELKKIREFKEDSHERSSVNVSFFQHAVRIIESYFNALRIKTSTSENNLNRLEENIFQWVLPNPALKSFKQEFIIQKTIELHNLITALKLNVLNDYSFDILKEYIKNEPLVKNINIKGFKSWKSNKQIRKNWQKDEAKRRKIKSEMAILKPKTIKIFPQQIDIIKSYLLSNQFLKKWRNHSGRDLDNSIGRIHPDWLGKSVTEKLEAIYYTEKYFSLESEHNEDSIAFSDQSEWAQNDHIYEYLENKIDAKIPFYEFYYQFWIRSSTKLDYNKFDLLISTYKDLVDHGIELNGLLIGKFTKDFNPTTIALVSNENWILINSRTYYSRSEFETKENNSNKVEPVLNNYSSREIADFGKYVRREYPKFIAKNRNDWEREYYSRKQNEFHEFTQSRSRLNTGWRQEFKSAIQYIDRLWSEKRKKPTKLAYLNQIGFQSAQWFQPMTIASAELVSQYLPLRDCFDLVIIDESSQVNVVSAIPSLARAKSAVIVGDRKQLSPTRFFRNISKEIESYDSLLELAEQKLVSHSLTYHYRSKSSNLIEYSNANFYNNQLQVGRYCNPSALEYNYIGGQFIQRTNLNEAEAIVDYISNKLDLSKNHSLGIIAFSIQQKECIEDKIDDEISKNEAFKAKISILKGNKESLFIKNLENVQGDERDIIFISTGYGKNENNIIYQFFGPLLQSTGENRLNVAMSRAKTKMVLFTSLKSNEIKVTNTSSAGIKAFQNLLRQFEESKTTKSPQPISKRNFWEYYLSPFRR